MRSRTGCLTCRQRKLKCDEMKPICGQCRKAFRKCDPSPELVFRHQHNASMNGDSSADGQALKSFYAYKDTFHSESTWVNIPKNLTFFNTTNPYSYSPELDSPPPPHPNTLDNNGSTPSSTGPETNSHVTNGTPLRFTPETDAASCCERSSMPPVDSWIALSFDSGRIMAASQHSVSHAGTEMVAEQDHEIAFLLRWFSEGSGYWMDLFDQGRYFSSSVPAKALENPLLKCAAVAYSAKALARVQGRKPVMGGSTTRQARMELYPDPHSVDWYHKAAHFYNAAVSFLLQALKGNSESGLSHGPPSPLCKRTDTDGLLAASAILCAYEFLDASMPEWAHHLNGAKTLLLQTLKPSPTIVSKAWRATFWNIARQDMLAAFINRTRTRLDTEELSLWKEAGLLINEHEYIVLGNTTKEDLIGNALVWLMSKLVNFMATGDDLPKNFSPFWAGVPPRTLLDHWNSMNRQFQRWYDGLPTTFQQCARIRGENEIGFPEIWYSIPLCASTMQCYHMSKIQLLVNKPHESTQGHSTIVTRLNSYQSMLAACQASAREIIGISLARPDEAVRIQSIQPLFTAGQCLSDLRERQVVVDLLRDIEADIGWATDYRVKQLAEQWKWEDDGALESRR